MMDLAPGGAAMRDVRIESDLKTKLGNLADEIALKDEHGEVVAYVVPPGHRKLLYDLVARLFDDGENPDVAEQLRAGRFKTAEQVLAMLRGMDSPATTASSLSASFGSKRRRMS